MNHIGLLSWLHANGHLRKDVNTDALLEEYRRTLANARVLRYRKAGGYDTAKEKRDKHLAAGLCLRCKSKRHPDSKWYCPTHLEQHRTAARNRYRAKHGIPLDQ